MNTMMDFISPSWSKPLVWTLIHSMWQGLVIVSVLILLLRFIPSRKSSLRYLLTTISLGLLFLSSVVTYFYLSSNIDGFSTTSFSYSIKEPSHAIATTEGSSSGVVSTISSLIESNLYLITLIWMVGAFLFSIRIATGFVYISAMKRNAMILDDEWNVTLERLAEQINLKRVVALAESSQISVPFVTGYFKPLILLPVGMMSGLSMEQLESILVHELMHIKRNDYIVNIIQTFTEALFFFNPFVWIISSIIRKEREHCCDDEVVKHGNALAYAHALVRLEELNLSNRSLVLSLAENKNQLLKRIKRIMEKSVQNYSVKERMIPVVLLVIGLTCASWVTMTSYGQDINQKSKQKVSGDTTKPEKKSMRYSRKSVTVLDEDGNPKEVVTESYEGDDDLVSMGDWDEIPPVPEIEPIEPIEPLEPFVVEIPAMIAFPPIPAIEEIPAIPGFPDMMYVSEDTFPELKYTLRLKGEWGIKEFEIRLKEKFGDFYNKNQEEIHKMMREVSEELHQKLEKEWRANALLDAQRNVEIARAQMDHQKDAMKHQQLAMEEAQEQMEKMHHDQQINHEAMEKEMKAVQDKMEAFEKALKKELIKDGYLSKDEKVETINWNDDDVLTVNGKKIKESDQAKYTKLRKEFFKDEKHHGRPE